MVYARREDAKWMMQSGGYKRKRCKADDAEWWMLEERKQGG
jgi:hypothetical protein